MSTDHPRRFFSGSALDLGHVSPLPYNTFAELCLDLLEQPVQLEITRAEFHALSKKEQGVAKRVQYITPAAFKIDRDQERSPRKYEFALRCNLIALDIDDSEEAARLIQQSFTGLGDFGYIIWHTASSTPEKPRLRVMVSAEGIKVERYAAAVRSVAELLGLKQITTESRVSVQPMFLPTIFAGETESPVVALNRDGEMFMAIDIIEDDHVDPIIERHEPNADGVADIAYLRAPMENVTLADVETALSHLDPDMPMQQWIEVAAGLKHQFDSEEAYALWDKWSSKGSKYVDSDETEYRWKSLRAAPLDRSPVTIRSVFKMAQARGWTSVTLTRRVHSDTLVWLKHHSRSTEELLDEGTARIAKAGAAIGALERKTLMVALRDVLAAREVPLPLPDIKKAVKKLEMEQAKSQGVPHWAKGLCFITSLNQFYKHQTDRRFSPEVIDLMYQLPGIGEEKPMRPRDYLIQIANVPMVENLRYDPSRGDKRFFAEDDKPYVNTYRPTFAQPNAETAGEAGEIFHQHIRNLIEEELYQNLLIDFFAYHVQHPGKKVRWAVLLQSAQGAGKTFLAVALAAVLGRRNVRKLSASDVIDGNHNDWAYGQQLVVMEEVRIVGQNRYAVMDRLKPCISDDEISLHRKFEDHQTVPNITNYLMFTNHHDSLAIQDDDRRYFVLASAMQHAADIAKLGPDYFDRIFGMVRDNPGGLRSWLEQWKITDQFKPEGRAPKTRYLIELAENAASPLAAVVLQTINDEPHPLVRKDIVSQHVLRAMMDVEHIPPFSDQALASVLREMGWLKVGKFKAGERDHVVWSKGLPKTHYSTIVHTVRQREQFI